MNHLVKQYMTERAREREAIDAGELDLAEDCREAAELLMLDFSSADFKLAGVYDQMVYEESLTPSAALDSWETERDEY